MTYNHDKAKVTCPEAAAEVERLRAEIERLSSDNAALLHENKRHRFLESLRKASKEISKWPRWKREVRL